MAAIQPVMRPFGSLRPICRELLNQQAPQRFITTASSIRKPRVEFPQNLPDQFKAQISPRIRLGQPRKTIPVFSPPPKPKSKEPVNDITEDQLATLDPTGERKELFDRKNPQGIKVGDILRVTFKSGEPFSGVCINIRSRGIDTSFLLRNKLVRVSVELWIKVFSPNVKSVEVVQRSVKKVRRARLTYMRKPKHDMGSVESLVTQYVRKKKALTGGAVGRYKTKDI